MTLTTQQDNFALQLAELDKIQETCKKLLSTKHYQKIGEEGIHAIVARAKALGIHPFEALNGGFHCINGRVGMSTEMMAALARKHHHSINKDPKSNNECVILHGKRFDNGDMWTCQFTKDDAIAAGLWGTATWKKYPQIMLYNRAMSMLFRQLFPDLSLGAGYVEDELREITRTGDYQHSTITAQGELLEDKVPQLESLPALTRPTITTEQAKDLEDMLKMCSNETVDRINKFLSTNGMKSLIDLTPKAYVNIFTKAKEEIKELEEILNAPAVAAEVKNEG